MGSQSVFCMFGSHWVVMPCKVSDLLACWRRKGSSNGREQYLECYSSMLNVALWHEMNQRAFEDLEHLSVELKLILIRTLMEWIAAVTSHSSPSIFAFIDGCM